jgi:magnesium-transporting ATPase (P-type)
MWANSVLASGVATGVVVHTGRETRAAANSAPPRSKVGSIDLQVNSLAKLLFVLTCLTALVMVSVPLLLRWLEYGLKLERETQSLLMQQLLQASPVVRTPVVARAVLSIARAAAGLARPLAMHSSP